jgi:hypothetical protein
MKINFHIERLVLDGLPVSAAQGARIGDLVERELSRLIAAGGLDHGAGGAIARLTGPDIKIRRRDSAEATARNIALAIHKGVNGHARREAPR